MQVRSWIAIAALAASGSLASARQQQPPPPPEQGRAQEAALRPFDLYKLDALVGLEVKGAKNTAVGKIDDLCLNANDGAIDYVVLASGGIAGIGETKHLLAWRDLQLTALAKDGEHKCEARVTLSEEQVKALREFDKKAAKTGGAPKPSEASGTPDAAMTSVMTCTTEVKGHKLLDTANQELGEIEQVVIDASAGRVAYVVLGAGGMLGLGEKHYALPWRVMQLQRDGDGDLKIHANISKERLKSAPEFDREHWDKVSSPEWLRSVYAYYSADPYWIAARSASSDRGQPTKAEH
jgi:sporulation protein YlmC with PRC-barrel domain